MKNGLSFLALTLALGSIAFGAYTFTRGPADTTELQTPRRSTRRRDHSHASSTDLRSGPHTLTPIDKLLPPMRSPCDVIPTLSPQQRRSPLQSKENLGCSPSTSHAVDVAVGSSEQDQLDSSSDCERLHFNDVTGWRKFKDYSSSKAKRKVGVSAVASRSAGRSSTLQAKFRISLEQETLSSSSQVCDTATRDSELTTESQVSSLDCQFPANSPTTRALRSRDRKVANDSGVAELENNCVRTAESGVDLDSGEASAGAADLDSSQCKGKKAKQKRKTPKSKIKGGSKLRNPYASTPDDACHQRKLSDYDDSDSDDKGGFLSPTPHCTTDVRQELEESGIENTPPPAVSCSTTTQNYTLHAK